MENKTAMQEIMDIIEMEYNNGVEVSMKIFYRMLSKGLKKEKQQIIDAFTAGQKDMGEMVFAEIDAEMPIIPENDNEDAELYFNETFKTFKILPF